MAKIKNIYASEILNSKGFPTIETTVTLTDGATASASSPSGTSLSSFEAVDLKDHDPTRYLGFGVLKAVSSVNDSIAPKIIGMDANKQQEIDRAIIELDGTQNKGRLGANATISVSMALAKASAKSSVLPLFLYLRQFTRAANTPLKIPTPMFNLISGGVHAGKNLDFQEFLVIPASSKSFDESLEMGVNLYHSLKKVLELKNLQTLISDEGGFGPTLQNNLDAFYILTQAIESISLRLGFDIFLGLDAAANNFYSEQRYKIKDRNNPLSSTELIAFYNELNKQFKLLYLEDPLWEEDWDSWESLHSQTSNEIILCGDDLIATNPYRLQAAVNRKTIGAIVIKPNQIGTVVEALAVSEVAKEAGLKIVVSNRSGETNDDFIADFAVATSSDYVKFGAPARGERVAKYNRLLHIEKQLKSL